MTCPSLSSANFDSGRFTGNLSAAIDVNVASLVISSVTNVDNDPSTVDVVVFVNCDTNTVRRIQFPLLRILSCAVTLSMPMPVDEANLEGFHAQFRGISASLLIYTITVGPAYGDNCTTSLQGTPQVVTTASATAVPTPSGGL